MENPKTGSSICQYGSRIIARHLEAFAAEIEGVRAARDIEAIHRMRVASRRLRTALAIFPGCLPPKKLQQSEQEIRQITRALSRARDLDVQIELLSQLDLENLHTRSHIGIRRLMLRLKQSRERRQVDVIESLDRIIKLRVVENLSSLVAGQLVETGTLPPSHDLYSLAASTISSRLDATLTYDQFIHDPANVHELHQMRIATKNLRYAMEAFAPIYSNKLSAALQAARTTQELLGSIHDCDVWLVFLPEFLEKERARTLQYSGTARYMSRVAPGIQFFSEDRRSARDLLYARFIEKWDAWRANHLWEKLIMNVQAPVMDPGKIFPPVVSSPE